MVAEFRGPHRNVCALLHAARRRETILRRSFIALGYVMDYVSKGDAVCVSHACVR
jgi:hypothetical protein